MGMQGTCEGQMLRQRRETRACRLGGCGHYTAVHATLQEDRGQGLWLAHSPRFQSPARLVVQGSDASCHVG